MTEFKISKLIRFSEFVSFYCNQANSITLFVKTLKVKKKKKTRKCNRQNYIIITVLRERNLILRENFVYLVMLLFTKAIINNYFRIKRF